MYALLTALLLTVLLFCLNHRRKRKKIQKVCSMCMDEKCKLLNELLEPFGYNYILSQDICSSEIDCWQREMGYCRFYDEAASHFGMVFDSLPVYFNYQGRTWLLEFFKGQYGINTGCEIGLYRADRILSETERAATLFQAVDDREILKMSAVLFRNDHRIAYLTRRHWWLTIFCPGCFTHPRDLSMCASVTFSSPEMTCAFVEGLRAAGYPPKDICRQCNTVTFTFASSSHASCSRSSSSQTCRFLHRLRIRLVLWMNRFWCNAYLFVTRPFSLTVDRILYLYYYLPFAFRRMLRIRRFSKRVNRKASRISGHSDAAGRGGPS